MIICCLTQIHMANKKINTISTNAAPASVLLPWTLRQHHVHANDAHAAAPRIDIRTPLPLPRGCGVGCDGGGVWWG